MSSDNQSQQQDKNKEKAKSQDRDSRQNKKVIRTRTKTKRAALPVAGPVDRLMEAAAPEPPGHKKSPGAEWAAGALSDQCRVHPAS